MSSKQMKHAKLGNSGLNVSKVIVGCMSYGYTNMMSWVVSDEEKIMAILKKCYDSGLRTFDTADVYSSGLSEILLGKFIKKYSIPREKIVILSKCFFAIDMSLSESSGEIAMEAINRCGLSRKHIFDAAKASVERLGTYMDVLQIHRLDDTPDEEIMKALHDVIGAGYTRYIGASTMRATDFALLQFTTEKNGWTKFVSMQNLYNLLQREEEREMNYFCKKTGVGLIPYSPNATGLLTRPLSKTDTTARAEFYDTLRGLTQFKSIFPYDVQELADKTIIDRVEEIAKKYDTSMAAVACAWVIYKGAFPIVGISSEKRVDDYIEAVNLEIKEADFKYLEEPYQPKSSLV